MTTTKPKERGLIFKDWEVRAIQEGRKTQKRVPIKQLQDDQGREFIYRDGRVWASLTQEELAPLDEEPPRSVFGGEVVFDEKHAYTPVVVGKGPNGEGNPLTSPFGKVGDLLYVRETWRVGSEFEDVSLSEFDEPDYSLSGFISYKADEPWNQKVRWRPSVHMPKWAARIWLEVTDVWVERLREISEEGIRAEAVDDYDKYFDGPKWDNWMNEVCRMAKYIDRNATVAGPKAKFAAMWDRMYAKKGFSWESNPWVFACKFKRIEERT